MADEREGPQAADDPSAYAPGVRALVRHPAAWPRAWTASATAEALERDPHTIGRWASAFGEGGPAALLFEQTGGSPPSLTKRKRTELKAGSATAAVMVRHGNGQLVLEGGAAVCFGTVRRQPVSQQLL